MAAQLCQAPQLVAYRQLLLSDPHLQSLLSLKECVANPHSAFVNGILEPLSALKRSGEEVRLLHLIVVCNHTNTSSYPVSVFFVLITIREVSRLVSSLWTACAKPNITDPTTAIQLAVFWSVTPYSFRIGSKSLSL
jgi:hypothetical protein